jgi:peptidoglycan hydrolase CwlO-like protein
MTEPDTIMLDILRKMQADQSELKKDNREIKESLSRLKRQAHSLRGDVQDLRGDFLRQGQTLTGLDIRVERIEMRLDLRDA